MWEITLSKYAQKRLSRLPRHIQKRIVQKLEEYLEIQDPYYNATQLKGFKPALHRYRVGDYRIVVQIRKEQKQIAVVDVGHRRDIYE